MRLDEATSWAPSGRGATLVIALLVLVANLVGVAVVVLFQLVISEGATASTRTQVLLIVAGYLLVALPVSTIAGLRRTRPTARWLAAGRDPTQEEAGRALRMPAV